MAHKAKKSKRFVYALDMLLKVRKIREKKAQEAYSQSLMALEEEKKKEEELKVFQNQSYQELYHLIASGEIKDVSEINRRKAHLEVLKVKVDEQIQKRIEAEKVCEEKKELLVQALKDRKIIEKDKEHKREAWKKLMDVESGKFLDDISSVKFVKDKQIR